MESSVEEREAEGFALGVPRLGGGACEEPHPADVALPFGYADRAPGIEDVEVVAALDDRVVRGKRKPFEGLAVELEGAALPLLVAEAQQDRDLLLVLLEEALLKVDVCLLEVIGAPLPLGALVEVTVADAWGPLQLVHIVDVLQVHRDPLEPVGQLAAYRFAVDAATLLEVGELADLEPIEPHLPTEAPCAERRRLPVVLDETDVVVARVGAEGAQ
jgi:hypothetical protein